MRIENYLGFPTGLTGAELTDRATLQANKFGAHLSIPTTATRLSFENGYAILDAGADEPVTAKCVLIATALSIGGWMSKVLSDSKVQGSITRQAPPKRCSAVGVP
jgi:hypothetical protein